MYGRVSATQIDTAFYQFAAGGLASGAGYLSPAFQPTAGWPPGFPFVISLLYRVFGPHLKLALALNVVLATATAVLVYLVAERIFDRAAARVAGGLFVVLPGPLFFTGLFLSETMAVFIVMTIVALAVFLPNRHWSAVLLGVALGLAALTRGEGLLLAVVPLATWWGHLPTRKWLRRTAIMALAMALTIAPWTIRNVMVMDSFIPVANNASWTLWAGHNPRANGGPVYPADPSLTVMFDPAGPEAETRRAAVLRRRAIDWATHNPFKELGLVPKKLLSLNGRSSGVISGWINQGASSHWQLGTSSVLVFGVLADAGGYFLLLATLGSLFVFGARSLWHRHPGMQGVLAYLAVCLLNFGFVYYGQYRYRIPMEPLMILIAAPLLVAVWRQRATLLPGDRPTRDH